MQRDPPFSVVAGQPEKYSPVLGNQNGNGGSHHSLTECEMRNAVVRGVWQKCMEIGATWNW
jgi:hypothetical protein